MRNTPSLPEALMPSASALCGTANPGRFTGCEAVQRYALSEAPQRSSLIR